MSRLEPGDAVIFSSRIIPGNEHAIGELQNALIRRGVRIVTERDHSSMSPAIRRATSWPRCIAG